MPKHLLNSLAAFLLALVAVSCSKVPSRYIQPEPMARLMADIHTAEAVIESNRYDYDTDSARQALKQSVYERHGVTSAQVDSSLAWYGYNIGEYMNVYDRTIELLEQRLAETGSRVAAEAAMSLSGDSVDVWTHPRMLHFTPLSGSHVVAFGYQADDNWQKGDYYTLRAKFFNNHDGSRLTMAAEYADGKLESVYNAPSRGDGWHEIVLRTDSTKIPERIFGYFEIAQMPNSVTFLDSIELVRKRLDDSRYYERHRQHSIKHYTDSI